MANREKIDQHSLFYGFLKVFWIRVAMRRYYRKIEVVNQEVVKKGEAVILAPNHQNALMDAMAFVGPLKKHQVLFFARADIFKKKFITNLLTIIKIMPVYRIRDGRSSLQKNDEIFEYGARFLKNKHNPICIFPEGNHGDRRRLRQLVKGIFRIAFAAQEESKENKAVKIIPVGIDYGHYQKFRSTLFVNYGTPIEVSEYWKEYEENNAVGTNKLRDKLSGDLKKLMINIETEEYYDLYMELRSLYTEEVCKKLNLNPKKLSNKFKADKLLIEALDNELEKSPNTIAELKTWHDTYRSYREKYNLRDWLFRKSKYSIIGNLLIILANCLLTPLALLGLFNNWPNFIIPPKISAKTIKDPQFVSTFTWGLGLVFQDLFYLILIILCMIFLPFWWLKVIYILTLWRSGHILLIYRKVWIKSLARIRYTLKQKELSPAVEARNKIEEKLEQIVSKHLQLKENN